MHILHVVGARPNFMKAAPVFRALRDRSGVRQTLVHTGQHYDANMSDIFFVQLEIPAPDINLEVGAGTHAQQTAKVMIGLEETLLQSRPDLVLVYGDVNSTMAAAVVCSKLQIPVGHVEAGLRSFDRTMPEEVNRIITDRLSDMLFTPSEDGDQNLAVEGVPAEKIHLVGNVMIDTLVRLLPRAQLPVFEGRPREYALVTLHRPSNVDDPTGLTRIIQALEGVARELPVLFPAHPRTQNRIAQLALNTNRGLHIMEPLGYLEFLALQREAVVVITDSGGVQEESTYLQVPCLTLRENTERPITVTMGTNMLLGSRVDQLGIEIERIMAGEAKRGSIPPLWDGHAAERAAAIVAS